MSKRPVKPTTAADYRMRIDRVMRAIADDLDAPLDLAALAEIACFSPYHFHRVYREIAGETAAETVRRLRLHRAATALSGGAVDLSAVARQAGYGGVDAFSRAFAVAYGQSPKSFAARGRIGLSDPFGDATIDPRSTQSEDPMSQDMRYDVVIESRPALTLAVMRHVGPYAEIGPVFERLMIWAGGRGLPLDEPSAIAVYYDDPGAVPAAELRSDAGLVVPPAFALDPATDGEIRLTPLAAGRYAALTFKGPYADLEAVYGWLYGAWLPSSGHEPADSPSHEEYLNDPKTTPPSELLTVIRVPLKD